MRQKKVLFSLLLILLMSLLVMGCSSSTAEQESNLSQEKLNVAVNMPQELLQSITADVKLTEIEVTVTNLDNPSEQHVATKEASNEVAFQFDEVKEGSNYEVVVRVKDEDGYWAYQGSNDVVVSESSRVEITPELLSATNLAVNFSNLDFASTGQVSLVNTDFAATIDFTNSRAEFETEIPANDYSVVVKLDGELVKKGELSLYPGRSTVAKIDMGSAQTDLGELAIDWKEPADDFEAPYVKPSLEAQRYFRSLLYLERRKKLSVGHDRDQYEFY